MFFLFQVLVDLARFVTFYDGFLFSQTLSTFQYRKVRNTLTLDFNRIFLSQVSEKRETVDFL